MSTPNVEAGSLYIDVEANTTGLGRDLQRKINAETKTVRARIKAEIDTRSVVKDARAAAREASKAATVRIKAELDSRGLVRSAKQAAVAASAAAVVKVRTEIDARKLQSDVAVAAKEAEAGARIEAKVDADTAVAKAKIEAVGHDQKSTVKVEEDGAAVVEAKITKASRNRKAKVDVSVNSSSLAKTISQLSIFPFLAGGVMTLVQALVSLGSGLFAVAAAAAPAINTLAILPSLAGAAVQSIAAIGLGASGIGDAVSAMMQSQSQAQATAQQVQSSTDAIAAAQQNLADARVAADQRVAQAAIDLRDAEWANQQAVISAREAQEDLNKARADAKERIEDLNRSLAGSILDQKQAELAVKRARQAMLDVNYDPGSTALDRKEARLAYQQAQQALKDAKDGTEDLRKETKKANAEGVKGSDSVGDARNTLLNATHSQIQAEESLAAAQKANATAAADGAKAITAAATALRQAQQAGATATATQSALAAAMEKLSPAGRTFVKFLVGTLIPRFQELKKNVQEALLPPVQEGITRAMPFLDTLERGLVGTADKIGGVAVKLGTLFSRKTFNDDVGKIMDSNNRAVGRFGSAGVSLVKIFRDLAVAAIPLVGRFSKWIKTMADGLQTLVASKRHSGELRAALNDAGDVAAQLGRIFKNLATWIFGIGKAARPTGQDLLNMFEGATKNWSDFSNSVQGQEKISKFFEDMKPTFESLMSLVKDLTSFIGALSGSGTGPLKLVIDAIDGIVRGATALVKIKGVGPVINALLALALAGGALGIVAGKILKISGNIQKLGKVTGINKVVRDLRGLDKNGQRVGTTFGTKFKNAVSSITNGFKRAAAATGRFVAASGKRLASAAVASGKAIARGAAAAGRFAVQMGRIALQALIATGRFIVQTAVMLAQRAAMIAASVAAKVWAGAQWLLNVALNANPISLIIIAIIALVAAFILVWKHSETFRKIVTGALHKVLSVVQFLWGWIKEHWPLLLAILAGPFGLAVLLIVKNWDKIKSVIFGAIGKIKGILQGIVDFIKDRVGGAFDGLLSTVSGVFNDIVHFIGEIPGRLKNLAGNFLDAGKALIGKLFDGLGAAGRFVATFAKDMVNGIIDTINTQVIDRLNSLLEIRVNLPFGKHVDLDPPDIPSIPELATGGRATKRTLAVIGEGKEPESVLPDSVLGGLLKRAVSAGMKVNEKAGHLAEIIAGALDRVADVFASFGDRMVSAAKARPGAATLAASYATPAKAYERTRATTNGMWLAEAPTGRRGHDLGGLSAMLSSGTTDRGGVSATASPLVGELHLTVGDKRDVPDVMSDVEFNLRKIRQGGVHRVRRNTP